MQESITATDLHVLADVTILANCAAVYVVVYQPNSVSQDLVTCEWQISKHSIKVPRLKLISTHMGNKFSTKGGSRILAREGFNFWGSLRS